MAATVAPQVQKPQAEYGLGWDMDFRPWFTTVDVAGIDGGGYATLHIYGCERIGRELRDRPYQHGYPMTASQYPANRLIRTPEAAEAEHRARWTVDVEQHRCECVTRFADRWARFL